MSSSDSRSGTSPPRTMIQPRVNTTAYELKVQRRLNREKVLEFEKEMLSKLQQLQDIEKKMTEINNKRVEWLKNISSQHYQDTSFFQYKLQLIKTQSDLISNQLKMDILRLESQLETLQLATLVEGTRALDINETLEKRELAIFLRQKTDVENIKLSIQSSIDYRIQLANYLYQLIEHLQEIHINNNKQSEHALIQIQTQLNHFREQMKSTELQAKNDYQLLIQDYLVLRHNSNVIQEIIQRNQNQCIYHRNRIQQDLQQILLLAKEKQSKLQISNNQEITALTNDVRQEIIHKEQIVEELMVKVNQLKQKKQQNYQSLVNEIIDYEKKIITLEQKRKEETETIQFEIKYLRQTIHGLQSHLFQKNQSLSERENNRSDEVYPMMRRGKGGAVMSSPSLSRTLSDSIDERKKNTRNIRR